MMRRFFFLTLLPLLLPFLALGQEDNDGSILFQIGEPSINEFNGHLIVELVAKKKGQAVDITVDNLDFKELQEEKGGLPTQLEVARIEEIKSEKENELTVLFLIDVSGSMLQGNKFEGAKEAVLKTIRKSNLPETTTFLLATFHDIISENIPFTKANIQQVLDSLQIGKDTNLYTAIIDKTKDLNRRSGKKALILLSDGMHDIGRNPRYLNDAPKPQVSQVYESLHELDSDVLLFPVGLGSGADVSFLQSLVDTTSNLMDIYSFSSTPEQLDSIFTRLISGLTGTYRIELKNNSLPYIGDARTLTANWLESTRNARSTEIASSSRTYRHGRVNYPIPYVADRSLLRWLLVIGFGFILLLYIILSLLIPVLKKRAFKKRYVVPHVQQGKRVVFDTVTNEPIEEGTLVVNKCQQLIPLNVWEGVGEKCPHFPECIHSLGCDGAGAKEINADFFSQKGELKRLNWLWFGAIGGFLSWILYAVYRGIFGLQDFDAHHKIVTYLLDALHISQLGANGLCINCVDIANDTYVGVCVGIGLSAGLSLPEQLNHLQGFSILKYLYKVLLGSFIGGISFFIGAILQPDIISSSFLGGLITWLLFGIFFGLILTIQSYVSLKRALLAAPLASSLSFLIYYFSFVKGGEGIEPLRLFSLIILGALIGYVIVTVVSSLEDFELEFVAPDQYRGHLVPISKWLQQGMTVSVGKAPKNQVYIKWIDESVLDKHAQFTLNENRIYIEPLGDVLINNRFITKNKRTALKNMDIIQLGRYSRTQLRYKEKRTRLEEGAPAALPQASAKKKTSKYG